MVQVKFCVGNFPQVKFEMVENILKDSVPIPLFQLSTYVKLINSETNSIFSQPKIQ